MRKRIIAVIGSSQPDMREASIAEETGRRLAQAGCIVVTGGREGVMEAASRGARRAGGIVVGILPDASGDKANPHVDIPIATGLGDARNAVIANTAEAFIAVGGGMDTLSEIAFALKRNKPVVGVLTWELDPNRLEGPWSTARTAAEAVERLVKA